eukprot:326173_1
MILEFIVTSTFLSVAYVLYDRLLRFPGYPPGPFRWPITGNLNILSKGTDKRIEAIQQSFNTPIMTLLSGSRKVVICNSPESLPSLTSAICAGRFQTLMTENGHAKLEYQQGLHWSELSKMSQTFLLAQNSFLNRYKIMMKNITYLVEHFREKSQNGKPFDANLLISNAVFNSSSELIIRKTMEDDTIATLENNFGLKHSKSIIHPMIESTMASFTKNSPAKSYVDLILQKKQRLATKGKHPEYMENRYIMFHAFSLIVNTGANFVLRRVFTKIASNYVWQEKLYGEVTSFGDKLPSASEIRDPTHFPILIAFVKEVLRIISPEIHSQPRRLMKDTQICGYKIQSGTEVRMNTWALHFNDSVWSDPFRFDPNRFLPGGEGIKNERAGWYHPFGIEPRKCPGWVFGEEQVLLIMFHLLREFKFIKDDIPTFQREQASNEIWVNVKQRQQIIS